jgi:catechol 2,3-dioxygenase-like lactoylglutathione lyase family enzyme
MSTPRLEHVNLSVTDPERAARLMQALFGWRIRWQGAARNGGRTIHVGSDRHYLALHTNREVARRAEAFTQGEPLNHVGVEVDDLEAVEAKVVAAGLRPFNHAAYDPGRRFYFLDPDGIEFEVVSYR